MAKRRHRARNTVIVLVILVVLAGIAVFVSDSLLRRTAEQTLRDQLAANGVTASEVKVEGGLMLPQIAAKKLDDLRFTVPSATFGGINAGGTVRARGVDYAGALTADEVELAAGVEVGDILGASGYNPLPSVTWSTRDGNLLGSTQVEVFGNQVPISFTVVLSASDGHVYAAPGELDVGGLNIGADLLHNLFGGGHIEVPTSWMPSQFTITSVRVEGSRLLFTAEGHGVVLDDLLAEVS